MKQLSVLIAFLFCSFTAIAQKGKLTEIQFGMYGGITGQKIGYSIQLKKRTVEKIVQNLRATPEKQKLFKATGKQLKPLKKYIRSTNVLATEFMESGNMTYYLLFLDQRNQIMREINWSDQSKTPLAVKDLYTLLQQFVAQKSQ